MSENDQEKFLYLFYVSAYYGYRSLADEVVTVYQKKVEWNPHFSYYYSQHADFINNNLRFSPIFSLNQGLHNVSESIDTSLTLTTAFYNLGQIENNTQRRQAADYMKEAEFIFRLEYPIVFYTTSEYVDYITARRRFYQLENYTLVTVKPFEQLPYYKYLDRASKCWHRDKPTFSHATA